MNKDKIRRIHDAKCDFCNTDFEVEDIEQLMMDPYNGIIVECRDCKSEIKVDVYVETSILREGKEE